MAMASYLTTGQDSDLSWKEFFKDASKSTHADFKHRFSIGPLSMHSRHNPSRVSQEELVRRELALLPSLIWACCKTKDLSTGTRLHYELQNRGLAEKNYSDALITMYAKCGELRKAQTLLDMHSSSSVIPWTALIAGYAQQRKGQNALDCFERMQRQGIHPNTVTYVCVLKACAVIGAIHKGKQIHTEISGQGLLEHSIVLGTALVDMYAKCGALSQAQSVLEKLPSRDVVSWSALISGYSQNGQGQKSLECFEQMLHEGIPPNAVTYVGVLKACAVIGAVDKGRQIHEAIARQGLLEKNAVLGNALVDMYAKCGALSQAHSVLVTLPFRDVVSWTSLIAGYAEREQGQQALERFQQMQREGILPDAVTYLSVLKACAAIGAIDKGKQIHDEIFRQGLLEHHILLGSALVDMYAKCGALSQARSVLEKLPSRNVVSWSALITGYAQKGQGKRALECFEKMQQEGIHPDAVTFLCILNLCSHLGLVEKGQELFDSMEARYGLKPDVECFTAMVNLLGCAGHLAKAVEVIQGMPFPANTAIWHCLLGACQKWVDVDVGTWAFEQAVELDECDGTVYISMINIFVAAGMQEKVKDIEAMRQKNKAWKPTAGCSSVHRSK
ncbi:hypothetical protein GOP47_0026103 [Adiantum capillus-veneris]|uniref:Pentatricopeptide repeat-containing protein n=1 Tax=Adiantum capillus-veneris TaxID=13818 RepID=A0A9D4Z3G8_ADICA|nr:hypothetical protein GOP47_0026103 [Adiantum capillus-veneris]